MIYYKLEFVRFEFENIWNKTKEASTQLRESLL